MKKPRIIWLVTYLTVEKSVEVERTEEVTPTFREWRYTEQEAKQYLQYHSKDRLILNVEIRRI